MGPEKGVEPRYSHGSAIGKADVKGYDVIIKLKQRYQKQVYTQKRGYIKTKLENDFLIKAILHIRIHMYQYYFSCKMLHNERLTCALLREGTCLIIAISAG